MTVIQGGGDTQERSVLSDAGLGHAGHVLRDRYRLLHVLGTGAGGSVYKAVQFSTGQAVAIKLLRVEENAEEDRGRRLARFKREIAICSALYHPDIVRLLDSGGIDETTHFAAFEFIPGQTLAELLRDEGMLRVSRARNLMAQLLPPLAYAYASGVAHRDLKPSNIMVSADGGRDRVKILDFGISMATGPRWPDVRLTRTHEWVGTPAYAAPEQLRGEPLGAKSDLYAWGLLFVECLTGAPLVSGRTLAEILECHLAATPHELPRALQQHRLGGLLARVLEKDPARRPEDANIILSALERFTTDDLEDAQGYLRHALKESLHPAPSLSDTLVDARARGRTEVRNATILCCRLTPAGARAQPVGQIDGMLEDASALVCEILNQFGAHPAYTLAGYSIAYWGLQHARDADPRLAVRASLELGTRSNKLPFWAGEQGPALLLQVGIHNGPVTFQVSADARRPLDGSCARVAMRLAELGSGEGGAAPRILVSEDFRQLAARYGDFEVYCDGAAWSVPWLESTPAVYRLEGESRLAGVGAVGSPFVGRASEMAALRRFFAARGEAAGAVLLIGEAGIGKSRLAHEFASQLQLEGVRWLETRCLPEWQNAFLRPIATLVSEQIGLTGLPPKEGGIRLEGRARQLGLDAATQVPLLCSWLSLPLPSGYSLRPWSPQKQRQLLLRAVAATLRALLASDAALLVEDLHWADSATLECIDVLRAARSEAPVFLLLTSRPGPSFSWALPPEVLSLGALGEDSSRELALAISPELSMDPIELAQLAARSDGVPLYVEELALRRTRWHPQSTLHDTHARASKVPVTLRDLLASRLEEAPGAHPTAELAAALGREFSLALLTRLAEVDEYSVLGDVEALISAGLVIKRLHVERPEYSFRHALIRDSVYERMGAETRRRTHERIAQGMELHFPELSELQPDLLGRHWELGGNAPRALSHLQRAARRAKEIGGYLEALRQLEHALLLLAGLPDSPERTAREAELVLARASTRTAMRGYADPVAVSAYERVVALIPADSDRLDLAFAGRLGLWYSNNTGARLTRAWELATELRAVADLSGQSQHVIGSSMAICETAFCRGRLVECVHASRRCAAEYDFERRHELIAISSDDPHLAALSFEAQAELLLGNLGSALARTEEALEHARRLGYPHMLAAMHGQAAKVFLFWGSSGARGVALERAREHARLAIALSQKHEFRFWEAYGGMLDAAVSIASGDWSTWERLQATDETWRATGAMLGSCWHLAFIGAGLNGLGRVEEACAALRRAIEFCERHDSRYFEPEARRLYAEVLFQRASSSEHLDEAWLQLERALQSARLHGARWWALGCLLSAVRWRGGSAELGSLRDLLREFPLAESEPPLLVEARALCVSLS